MKTTLALAVFLSVSTATLGAATLVFGAPSGPLGTPGTITVGTSPVLVSEPSALPLPLPDPNSPFPPTASLNPLPLPDPNSPFPPAMR